MVDHTKELIKMLFLVLVVIALAVAVLYGMPTRWIESRDGDFQQAFLALVAKQDLWEFPMKETMSRIVTAWWETKCGGVILVHDQDVNDVQIIEFKTGAGGPQKVDGIPVIGCKWTRAKSLQDAKLYLRKYPRVEKITCADEVYALFLKHMSLHCRTGSSMDTTTGSPVFEGFLPPTHR